MFHLSRFKNSIPLKYRDVQSSPHLSGKGSHKHINILPALSTQEIPAESPQAKVFTLALSATKFDQILP